MKTSKILGTITVLYLLVFIWLKAVNELSFKSVEHFADISLVLIAAIISGVCLTIYEFVYLRFFTEKKNFESIFFDRTLNFRFPILVRLVVSFATSFILMSLVDIKTKDWGELREIIPVCSFIITFFVMYTSISEINSKDE